GIYQQRQEGLNHAVSAEQIDRQVPFERIAIAQVIEEEDARIVDQDVQRLDLRGGRLYLPLVGDVQGKSGDARGWVGVGPPRSGVHPRCAAAEGFGDQRFANAPVGPGDQDGLAFDRGSHAVSFRRLRRRLPGLGGYGLLVTVGQPATCAYEGAQAGVQVKTPGIRADVKALELRHEADVGEADFGPAVFRGYLKVNVGVIPLGFVLREIEIVVQDGPGDSPAGDKLGDPDP